MIIQPEFLTSAIRYRARKLAGAIVMSTGACVLAVLLSFSSMPTPQVNAQATTADTKNVLVMFMRPPALCFRL